MEISFINVDPEDIAFRRKFCLFKKEDVEDDDTVVLCRECYFAVVVDNATSSHLSSQYCWPAFVWSYMCNSEARLFYGNTLWRLIPVAWREWWLASVQNEFPEMFDVTIDSPKPFFVEISKRKEELDQALQELKWVQLGKAVDAHASLPLVKCPWGCSEFINETKHVPLDAIFCSFLKDRLPGKVMSSKRERMFADCIRGDFFTSAHHILYNKKWLCSPSIAYVKEKGPVVLTCRFHDRTCKGKYIHVPYSPTGTLMTEASDQLAPAVLVPKTIHKAKAHEYTNAFQMNELSGHYDGLDSVTLADHGRYDTTTFLSVERDALSIAARPDIASHVEGMADKQVIPRWFAEDKLYLAGSKYPSKALQEARVTYSSGSTYVTMEDAMKLEAMLKWDGGYVVSAQDGNEIQFKASWVKSTVFVHPPDQYGASFPLLPRMSSLDMVDTRLLWCPVAMISLVPTLWTTTANVVSNTVDWYGWLLAYASQKCFPERVERGSRNNPFRMRKKEKELVANVLAPFHEDGCYDPSAVAKMFGGMAGAVSVAKSSDVFGSDDWSHMYGMTASSLVVFHDISSGELTPPVKLRQSDNEKLWDLRLILSTFPNEPWQGTAYSRHGTDDFPKWWCQSRGARCPIRIGQIPRAVLDGKWDICVYVDMKPKSITELKEKYLLSCGGQITARCNVHKLPLVISCPQNGVLCASCEKEAYFVCPQSGCSSGLCKKHQGETESSDVGAIYVDPVGGSSRDTSPHRPASRISQLGDDFGEEEEDDYDDDWIEDSSRDGEELIHDEDEDDGKSEREDFYCPFFENDVVDAEAVAELHVAVDDELENLVLYNAFETDHIEPDDDFECQDDGMPATEHFPTTNIGHEPMAVCGDRHIVGSHVIFNKHGRLLVRENTKLEGTRRQRNFLQKLICNGGRGTVPLVYPEGMIYPSIFWDSRPDGSILGSIPSALLCDNSTLKGHGFATLHEHMRTRVMDASLLTSTDHRYQYFALDACINLGMRGQDSRIILSRGFGEQQGAGGIRMCTDEEKQQNLIFDSDSVDSRPTVNKLAAALGEQMATLFFTHTCNMKHHFGMRILKRWLDSNEAIREVAQSIDESRDFSYFELEQIRKDLLQSSCGLALRCWINVTQIYMTYITKSSEHPIGELLKAWWRYELQELEANVPHIHSILWLLDNDGTPEGIQKILNRIRASIGSIVTSDEFQDYMDRGILSSYEELVALLEDLKRILNHKHNRRCMVPVRPNPMSPTSVNIVSANGDRELTSTLQQTYRCKVPDNRMLSPNPTRHTFISIAAMHSRDALEILNKIGVIAVHDNRSPLEAAGAGNNVEYLEQSLVARRHVPPTNADDGIISPVLAPLIVMNPNSNNVQYLDGIGVTRYLASYCAQVDECNRLYVHAPNFHDRSTFKVEAESVGNTKIASVSHIEQSRKQNDRRNHRGRLISQPEALMLLLNVHQVYTDIKFVHVPSVPLEERPAFDRISPIYKLRKENVVESQTCNVSDLDASRVIFSHAVRVRRMPHMPSWRHFCSTALVLAKDQLFCPFSLDGTTIFGLRPPELYFIRHQALYLRCFERRNVTLSQEEKSNSIDAMMDYCARELNVDYRFCAWIDATCKVVQLRVAAIDMVCEYIENAPVDDFGGPLAKPIVKSFFAGLKRNIDRERTETMRSQGNRVWEQWQTAKNRFLCAWTDKLVPVVWFTNIKPIHSSRFLVHILLSMGAFLNEMELMQCGSIRSAFIKARLFDPTDPEESINQLTKRYVMEQLKNLPGGTPQFDRFVAAAYKAFQSALLHNQLAADGLPPYLYTHLKREASEKTEAMINSMKRVLTTVVLQTLRDAQLEDLPSLENILAARMPYDGNDWEEYETNPGEEEEQQPCWNVNRVTQSPIQSDASYTEQTRALRIGAKAISEYLNVQQDHSPKAVCIVGDPGAGKTTVLMMLALHGLCHGLNVATTALLCERALQIGGRHLHWMVNMAVREGGSPAHIAELSIANLYRDGMKLEWLRRLDILALDELGQWPAESIAVLDIILRRVRNSTRFMGGILLICTKDILQLLPIDGRPPMLSPHMITSFQFTRLQHSIRAALDQPLQRIQAITRLMPTEVTVDIKNEFRSLIARHCTFVSSFDDPAIPDGAIFLFGRKEPGKEQQARKMAQLRAHGGIPVRAALDQETTTEGNWTPASTATKKRLDNKVREVRELYFFAGAAFEFTYIKKNCFSTSQLALLMDAPSQDDLDHFRPIEDLGCPARLQRATTSFGYKGRTAAGWLDGAKSWTSTRTPKEDWVTFERTPAAVWSKTKNRINPPLCHGQHPSCCCDQGIGLQRQYLSPLGTCTGGSSFVQDQICKKHHLCGQPLRNSKCIAGSVGNKHSIHHIHMQLAGNYTAAGLRQ